MAKGWSCVEADCDYAFVAADEATAIELAQRHIAEVHDSFELDDMIEAVLEDVPDGDQA